MMFSASYTDDISEVVKHIKQKYPKSPLFGIGYSLGSNIMTKYVGEEGNTTVFQAIVGISTPFNLIKCQ